MYLGDKKPSHLLRAMRDLSKGALSDDALKSLWLQRLPTNIQAVLSVSNDTLPQLAFLADRVLEVTSSSAGPALYDIQQETTTKPTTDPSLADIQRQLDELRVTIGAIARGQPTLFAQGTSESRPRSRSTSRSRPAGAGPALCWYHWQFGAAARKCIKPCTYESTKPPENTHPHQ